MCFESFELSSFENVIEPECDVILYLCCIYGSGCLYIILCRAAPNISGIHIRSNNKDNICLYRLQLCLLEILFFFFVTTRQS